MEVIFLDREDLSVLDFGYVEQEFNLIIDSVIPQKSTFSVNKLKIDAEVGDLVVIKDKEIAESKLPEIESKKDLLIQELTRRYEELQSYNEKIDEYNRLVKEAEEINERIQNNNY